uniref:Uncharacterized protein n=1 Tax=Anguilla anguilla TaxID=7936 RepID=A0A0E9RU80_ANGAN
MHCACHLHMLWSHYNPHCQEVKVSVVVCN